MAIANPTTLLESESAMFTQANLVSMRALLSFSLVVSCISLPVVAETYRWVDANGVVNYAEQKPRGVASDRVTVISDSKPAKSAPTASPAPAVTSTASTSSRATPASTSVGANSRKADLTAEQQRMLEKLEQAEQERQATVAQIREQNCQRSREVLSNLSAKDKIRVNMPDGSQRALPEDERLERIRQAQDGIVRNCNS